MEALCLYAEPSSRASNPPSLKGYGKSVFMVDYTGYSGYAFSMQEGAFEHRRPERMENAAVSLIYTDEKHEVWVDAEKDNITLSMTDRGVTILFTRDEWLEFQEVIGNIMLEEEPEEEENE
jgi:hypothetical protein